jgi:hypothetical protein
MWHGGYPFIFFILSSVLFLYFMRRLSVKKKNHTARLPHVLRTCGCAVNLPHNLFFYPWNTQRILEKKSTLFAMSVKNHIIFCLYILTLPWHHLSSPKVYYESMKRKILKPIYECRCTGSSCLSRLTHISPSLSLFRWERVHFNKVPSIFFLEQHKILFQWIYILNWIPHERGLLAPFYHCLMPRGERFPIWSE